MNISSIAKRARLGGAMLAASALVIAPPIALAAPASTAPHAKNPVAAARSCAQPTKTAVVAYEKRQAYGDNVFGVKGNIIVKLCTNQNGTKVFQTATQLKPIDNETARVALTVKKPHKTVVRGTTIIKRNTVAVVTTKWNNTYTLRAVLRTIVTPKGKVLVDYTNPELVK
jgi:hypothetical protein